MKQLFLALFITSSILANGQSVSTEQFIKDSLTLTRVVLVKPQFKFDNRITFNDGQALSITGFDIGVLLNEKLRLTLGYYTMKDRLEAYDYTKEAEEFGRLVHLKYGSLNTEIIYKDTRYLSLGLPLEIAAGTNTFQNKNITTGEIISTETGALIFVNFGVSATFKPMRFLGLKAIVGYRKTAFNQVEDFNFDGFFTAIGLNLDVRTIITDIKMYRLKKRYKRGNNIVNAVDIITD